MANDHGVRKHAWRTQARMAHASRLGQKKRRERLNDGDNNGQATHGVRKHAWRTQAAWAKKLGLSTHKRCNNKSLLWWVGKPNLETKHH